MVFFNKKEEVIDVQLTAFGRHLLAKGKFRPEYYCYFDDDILYDPQKAGVVEDQNQSQVRIIEETPKLKTQSRHYPIGSFNISGLFEGEDDLFEYNLESKSLLYKLANQEISVQSAPNYDVLTMDSKFTETETLNYQHFVNSGIIKNIPQLSSNVEYMIVKNIENKTDQPELINLEDNFDLSSEAVVFADNTSLHLTKSCLALDIEENNVYRGRENFFLEIYEIETDEATNEDNLRKLDSMSEINSLFHIKTDASVDQKIAKYRTEHQKNNQGRQED